ncbi:MAG: FecCD family ABC transporter permease [Gemmatimonadota bacterium]
MRTPAGGFVVLLSLLIAAVAAGLMFGNAPLSLHAVWGALSGTSSDPAATAIVRSIRLPRVAAGVLTGASLAVSGTLFQALLRNPLAEPYLLGVSSGAAFGAVASLTLFSGVMAGAAGTTAFALAGGLLAIGTVFRVAWSPGRVDTRVLILAGVVVSAFFGAGVMLLLALSRGDVFRSAVLWTMGSLDRATWGSVGALAVWTAGTAVVAFGMSRHLNALSLGEESAAHLGTSVEKVKRLAYLVASLSAAATVSVAGVIGFIGLVVPHAIRIIWGGDHRTLIPLSLLGGAAALVIADAVAQTVVRPLVLPVGVVTAVLGVPLFLALLRKSRV